MASPVKRDEVNNAEYDEFGRVTIALWPDEESVWTISSPELPSPREIHLESDDFPVLAPDTRETVLKLMKFRFSKDLRWLVTGALGVHPELWDLDESPPTRSRLPLEFLIDAEVRFSPDSRWLAASSQFVGGLVLDLSKLVPTEAAHALTGHSQLTNSLAFSSDSKLLASGSNDQTVCLYDVSGIVPRLIAKLRGHNDQVSRVEFSPDRRWLVSASHDGKTVVWDTSTVPIQSTAVLVHSDTREDAWLKNNNYFSEGLMVIGPEDGIEFTVIPLDRARLKDDAASFTGRNLSHPEWDEFFPSTAYERTFPQFDEGEGYPEDFEIF